MTYLLWTQSTDYSFFFFFLEASFLTFLLTNMFRQLSQSSYSLKEHFCVLLSLTPPLILTTFANIVSPGKWKVNVWQSPDMVVRASEAHGCSLFSRLISSPEESIAGCTYEVALLQVPTLLLARCQQFSCFFWWFGLRSNVWAVRSTRGDTIHVC